MKKLKMLSARDEYPEKIQVYGKDVKILQIYKAKNW